MNDQIAPTRTQLLNASSLSDELFAFRPLFIIGGGILVPSIEFLSMQRLGRRLEEMLLHAALARDL